MEFECLEDLVVEMILSKLGPRNVCILACVSRKCRSFASDENLWKIFCSQDINLLHPEDPDGNPCPTFKVAYKLWRESFKMYPWELVTRSKKCWANLKNWTEIHFHEAASTLQKGASESEIRELEQDLGVKLPVSSKVLFRFCNGQNTMLTDKVKHLFSGIIGGYSFYDHLVNVHLLPLSLVFEETMRCRNMFEDSSLMTSQCVVIANSTFTEKFFLLNCTSGQLCVGTWNFTSNGEMLPCVPHELGRLASTSEIQQQDAMLLWLEEHVRSLQSGKIQVRKFHNSRYINLFPEIPPLCSTAVTNGVQVRASALFIPELSIVDNTTESFWFSYSIRMCLLPTGCTLDGRCFTSCQLFSRHWIICANDNVVSDIQGEAVIGKFPLLSTSKEVFVYESCTPLPSSCGFVEGSFTFVPGRLTIPEGRQFEVEVGRFSLQVPDFIF